MSLPLAKIFTCTALDNKETTSKPMRSATKSTSTILIMAGARRRMLPITRRYCVRPTRRSSWPIPLPSSYRQDWRLQVACKARGTVTPGTTADFQDDREFLKELFTAGGGACLDAVGYHPYGFSADYDVDPDVVIG